MCGQHQFRSQPSVASTSGQDGRIKPLKEAIFQDVLSHPGLSDTDDFGLVSHADKPDVLMNPNETQKVKTG